MILDYKQGEIAESFQKSKPLPAGLYPVIVMKHEEGVSSKGNPKITFNYQIEAGAELGAGRTIINDYSMLPNSVWRWTNDVVALGAADADYFDGNAKVDTNKVCAAAVGRKGTAELLEPEEGFTNNKLKKIRPRG